MRIAVLAENLRTAMTAAARIVDNRPTLPVLANVLLRVDEDSVLQVHATNLEVGLTMRIGAKVEEHGEITLPAKTLSEIVGTMAYDRIDISSDAAQQKVTLTSATTKVNINGIDADEYPALPSEREPHFTVDGNTLKRALNHVMFASAKDESRPILTGVFFAVKGSTVTLAAADGYRLAVRTFELESTLEKPVSCVVPAKALDVVYRLIQDDDTIGIALPDSDRDGVSFVLPHAVIGAQVLEGRFPDFMPIIPRSFNTCVTIHRADLIMLAKRAEIFARDNANSARLEIEPGAGGRGQLLMIGKSAERGTSDGTMYCESFDGESVVFSCNVKYLLDVLGAMDYEHIRLELNGATNPVVIRTNGEAGFTHVIMPMSPNR